jgi:hypothetical protein
MLISQAQVDDVLTAAVAAIPVLALTYLATDRERFLLGRGSGGHLPDIIQTDPRIRDIDNKIPPEGGDSEPAARPQKKDTRKPAKAGGFLERLERAADRVESGGELEDLAWQLATERVDAFLGIVFGMITGFTFFFNLMGIILHPTPVWIFLAVICGITLNLDIILLGLTSQMVAEIGRKTPPEDSRLSSVKLGPSRRAPSTFSFVGVLLMTFYGFLVPTGIVIGGIIFTLNLNIR